MVKFSVYLYRRVFVMNAFYALISTLVKIFSRRQTEILILFFREKIVFGISSKLSRTSPPMHGVNLHEMSNPVFLGKIRKVSPMCRLLNYPRVVTVKNTKENPHIYVHVLVGSGLY